MRSSNFKYFLAATSAVSIWGIFSIPLRNIKAYSPEQILGYRTFIALLITWTLILIFRRKQLRADITYIKLQPAQNRRNMYWLILASGVLVAVNWLSFIYAVNHVSLKSAAFAYMVCPLLTAMCGFFILKEKLSRLQFCAIGVALISILISAQGSFIDVLWSVFIAASFAIYLIVQRVLVGIDKFNLLGVQLLIVGLLILPAYLYNPEPFPIESHFWTNITLIALLFTIIPLLLSSYSLIGLPSSTFGIIIYLNPIVAFAVAFFYFDEQITIHQLYAYSLLLVSVVLFNWHVLSNAFQNRPNKPNSLGT